MLGVVSNYVEEYGNVLIADLDRNIIMLKLFQNGQ